MTIKQFTREGRAGNAEIVETITQEIGIAFEKTTRSKCFAIGWQALTKGYLTV